MLVGGGPDDEELNYDNGIAGAPPGSGDATIANDSPFWDTASVEIRGGDFYSIDWENSDV